MEAGKLLARDEDQAAEELIFWNSFRDMVSELVAQMEECEY